MHKIKECICSGNLIKVDILLFLKIMQWFDQHGNNALGFYFSHESSNL